MRLSNRLGLAVAVVVASLSVASLVKASVVTATFAELEAGVSACAYPYALNSCHGDDQRFTVNGQPAALTASASTKAANASAFASLAADANATWSSPDSGEVNFNFLGSLFQDGAAGATAGYNGSNTLWKYGFTPNQDAFLKISGLVTDVTRGDQRGTRELLFAIFADAQGMPYAYTSNFSDEFDLRAGVSYTLVADAGLLEPDYIGGPRDLLELNTYHFTFDITAAPIPDPMGGVPEPATWAMLLAGFFAVGAALRVRNAAALIAHG